MRVFGFANAPVTPPPAAVYNFDEGNVCRMYPSSPTMDYYPTTGEVAPVMFTPITRALE
jgi:hypothetical protein